MASRGESMIGRRLLAACVDAMTCLILSYLAFALIFNPLLNATTSYNETHTSYQAHLAEYEEIQVEYGIYSYVDSSLKYNDDVTEETKETFLNDSRIVALKEIMASEQSVLRKIIVSKLILGLSAGCLVVYVILPLCLRKGRTFGKLVFKLVIVDSKHRYAPWYLIVPRYLIYIIVNIFGGLCSFALIPLANLILAIINKKNRAVYDLIFRLEVVEGRVPLEVLYPEEITPMPQTNLDSGE